MSILLLIMQTSPFVKLKQSDDIKFTILKYQLLLKVFPKFVVKYYKPTANYPLLSSGIGLLFVHLKRVLYSTENTVMLMRYTLQLNY